VDPGSSGFPTADYSVSLNMLTRGTHTVKIEVEAFTYYDDPEPEHGDYLTFSKNISETVYFTVNADMPTPSPTSTPNLKPQTTEQVAIVGVAVMVAVIGAGLGLLIHLIKRK
jgi:hypothetical protein